MDISEVCVDRGAGKEKRCRRSARNQTTEKDELEQVYLLEEGVEQKVLYKEKEVTLNRLKLARRDGSNKTITLK